MGSKQTIRVNLESLRRFGPDSEEADVAILGAGQALRSAIAEARLVCADLPVVDHELHHDLEEHYARCRVLADVFHEAARLFEKSQETGPLPSVFGRLLGSYMGPSADLNTPANRDWIDKHLRAARDAGVSKARGAAATLHRQLGLAEVRPYPVNRRVIETELGVSAGVSAGTRVVWELEELSNGVTTLTLLSVVSAGASVGFGATFGRGEQNAGLGFMIEGGEGWKKTFRSRTEAEAHIADHYLKALGENLRLPVPGFGLVDAIANRLNASGMRDAPVKEKIMGGSVSASASGDVKVGTGEGKGATLGSLSLGGSAAATISEQRDSRDKTHTDRFTTLTQLNGELLLGKQWSAAKEALAEVAVTRDSQGQALSMTVRTAFDDKPGKIAEIMGERRRDTNSGGTHRYEIERVYDLADPRNAQLQKDLSTTSDLVGRLDEDAKAVEQLWRSDADLPGRSTVSVIEQAPVPADDHKLSIDIASFGGEVGMTSSGYTTVDAWQTMDGKLRQVDPGPR